MSHAIKTADLKKAALRERRERIATAAMQGLLAYQGVYLPIFRGAAMAVAFADALIAELDETQEDKI